MAENSLITKPSFYLAVWIADGETASAVGDLIEVDGGLPAWGSAPRGLNLEAAGGLSLQKWIAHPVNVGLYRVEPHSDIGGDGSWCDADKWNIVQTLNPGEVLGPQADEILLVATKLAFLFDDDHPDRYTGHWPELHRLYVNALPEDRSGEATVAAGAARRALKAAGDDNDWDHLGNLSSCMHGDEYAALAARDLIGTVAGWTTDAYELLMLRFNSSFGQLLASR